MISGVKVILLLLSLRGNYVKRDYEEHKKKDKKLKNQKDNPDSWSIFNIFEKKLTQNWL